MKHVYMCIDLKSFYASVECVLRNLNPLDTNLVVADKSRTEKTVCLAVSPPLKKYGIGGRARLYEVISKVKQINNERKKNIGYKKFTGKSFIDSELENDKNLELDFIIATPHMAKYMEYSAKIYNTYLKYLSKDDIFVYSIDEVFCDITNYLKMYKASPRMLVTKIIHDVCKQTGITATAGIGDNLFLAKVAMDVVAKHVDADEYGVRIAELTEESFREKLWDFKPITKIWRIGPGIAKRLEENKMYTLGDVALMSVDNEQLLYKLFGVNAEVIIDHAWGYEPCTISDVRSYRPQRSSISSGQVLHTPYDYKKALLVVQEMADLVALDLVKRESKTNQIVLTLGYDTSNVTNGNCNSNIVSDRYGRKVPKEAHKALNLDYYTSSSSYLITSFTNLYNSIVNEDFLIRRITLCANNLILEKDALSITSYKQMNLFSENNDSIENKNNEQNETALQNTLLKIKNKYGKNAIFKGMNLVDGATAIERNKQIGGHKE